MKCNLPKPAIRYFASGFYGLVLASLITITPVAAEQSASGDTPVLVLDDIVVYANPRTGDTELVLDDMIVYGAANSDTIDEPTKLYSIWRSLETGEGVGVNFDFSFAKNSSVLTAEGNQLLGLVAKAIGYIGDEILFEIQTHNDTREKLSRDRVDAIVAELNSRYSLKNNFVVSDYSGAAFFSRRTQSSKNRSDIWRVTIVNKGRTSDNLSLQGQWRLGYVANDS